MAVEYNAYVPSPEEMQRRALRADGNFIGTGMLFLVALSQFLYTIVVLGLVFFHVIPYAYVGLNDLGLGNTSYLLLYMGVYIVMMGAPLPVAALIQRRRIQPFGPAKRVHPLAFAGGVLGGMAMCVVANIIASYIMNFLMLLGIPQPPMPDTLMRTPLSLGLNLLIFAVLPALLEEMVFRGYVLRTLRPYGDRTAILVSSLLFALMHGNVLQVPFAFIVGLVLGYVAVQTDNIWLAVVIHFGNNAMSTVLQYLQIGMSAEDQNRMTTLVFCVLALVGLLALILLKVRGSRLAAPVNRNGAHDPAFERAGGGAGLYDCDHRVYSPHSAEHRAERGTGCGVKRNRTERGTWSWRTKPTCVWRWSWRGRRRRRARCRWGR